MSEDYSWVSDIDLLGDKTTDHELSNDNSLKTNQRPEQSQPKEDYSWLEGIDDIDYKPGPSDHNQMMAISGDYRKRFSELNRGIEDGSNMGQDKTRAEIIEENKKNRSEFTRGLLSGIDETQAMLYGAASLVGSAIGDKEARDWGFENYKRNLKEAELNPLTHGGSFQKSIEEGDLGTWFAGSIGKMAPSMAEIALAATVGSFVSPGAGTVAGAVNRGLIKKFVEKRVLKAMESTALKKLAQEGGAAAARKAAERIVSKEIGSGIGVVLGSTALEAGGMFGEGAERRGIDESNPYTALGFGLISGATELVAPSGRFVRGLLGMKNPALSITKEEAKQFIKKAGKGAFIKSMLKAMPAAAAKEGTQEFVQEFISSLNEFVQDPNASILSPGNIDAYINSAAAGAAAGLLFGLGEGGVSYRNNVQEAKERLLLKDHEKENKEKPRGDIGKVSDAMREADESYFTDEELDQAIEKLPEDQQAEVMAMSDRLNNLRKFKKPSDTQKKMISELEQNLLQLKKDSTEFEENLAAADEELRQKVDTERKKADETLSGKTVEQLKAEYEEQRQKTGFTAESDRRTNLELRKRIDEMSPEEMRVALKTSHLTGLKNKRAYEESEKKPVQSSIDVDSLKWVNDNLGHEAGDKLLKTVGDALKSTSLADEAYHVSGDEFIVQADDEKSVHDAVEKAYDYLDKHEISYTTEDGRKHILKGSFSYGAAQTLKKADERLQEHKTQREMEGQRAGRGQEPPGYSGGKSRGKDIGGEKEITEPDKAVRKELEAVDQNPTEKQIEAGNYKKAHIKVGKFDITVENPAGTQRSGKDEDGNEWSVDMKSHYGYFKRSEGKDGDQVDVFVKPGTKDVDKVHIVNQVDPKTGDFDEHKIILGDDSSSAAAESYLENYDDGWKGLDSVVEMSVDEFESWLNEGRQKKPAEAPGTTPTYKPLSAGTAVDYQTKSGPQQGILVEQRGKNWVIRKPDGKTTIHPESKISLSESELTERDVVAGEIAAGNFVDSDTLERYPDLVPEGEITKEPGAKNDSEKKSRLARDIGKGKEPWGTVQKPEGGREEASTGGILQTQEKIKSVRSDFKKFKSSSNKIRVIHDNPGGRWLEYERNRAEDKANKGSTFFGSVTAKIDGAYLPTDVVAKFPGLLDEHKKIKTSDRRVSELTDKMTRDGFDPDKPIFINVRYDGEVFINEGNHRIRAAEKAGIETVPVEISYFSGGELEAGPLSSESLIKHSIQVDKISKKADIIKEETKSEPGQFTTASKGGEKPLSGVSPESLPSPEGGGGIEGGGVLPRSSTTIREPVPSGEAEPSGSKRKSPRGGTYGEGTGTERRNISEPGARPREQSPLTDYSITDSDEIEAGGKWTKADNNLSAIDLLKQLKENGLAANPDEQAVLVKYTGWGQFPEMFNDKDSGNRALETRKSRLKELLSKSEYEAARKSTLNAHYTSPDVVRAMYKFIGKIGFKGGKILDPSFGTGMFGGVMPKAVKNRSSLTAIEIDPLTAEIASHLYPRSNVINSGFEDFKIANNTFDLAISNVPFGRYGVYDSEYKSKLFIHEYFFVKALDKIRPGGIVAFITSAGMMNSQRSAKAREAIAKKADLITAVRLPGDAFKKIAGTEVTTDIIFLRKRPPGEKASGQAWIETADSGVISKTTGKALSVNEFYVKNPDNLLGEIVDDKLYPGRAALKASPGQDIIADLNKVLKSDVKYTENQADISADDEEIMAEIKIPAEAKDQSLIVSGDKIARIENGEAVILDLPKRSVERIMGLIAIRDADTALKDAEVSEKPSKEIKALRDNLNKVYDAFVKKNGFINDNANIRTIVTDPSYYRLVTLEVDYKPEKIKNGKIVSKASARKADIFSKSTISTYVSPTFADNASDALAISLGEYGSVNIDRIMDLTRQSEQEVIDGLKGEIFLDPSTNSYVTSDEYLSGDVKTKLEEAKKAKKAFNAEKLKEVIPSDKQPHQINARLGAGWIPTQYVRDFIVHITGLKYSYRNDLSVSYSNLIAKWSVKIKGIKDKADFEKLYSVYGTPQKSSIEILKSILDMKRPVVKNSDGVVMIEPTERAQHKAEQINKEFDNFIFSDATRSEEITKIYNDLFNRTVERKFDGSHLSLPGKAKTLRGKDFVLRQNQLDGIWRIITQGNTLLAHGVGAGKTFTMIGAGMELKRLKMAKKPCFTIPNHMVDQFASDFMTMYPNANIIVAKKNDLGPAKRKAFFGRVANNDWDGVIIPHSRFTMLSLGKENLIKHLKEQRAELRQAIKSEKEAAGKTGNQIVKQLENTLENFESRIKALQDRKTEDLLTFEEMGFDWIFVDEAHNFKNLYFPTKMQVAGLNNTYSKKATDLFSKTSYLDSITPGRGVVFATGTPLSNQIAEVYTNQRYLSHNALKAAGLDHFDAWAQMYANRAVIDEISPDGRTFRQKERLSNFKNIGHLQSEYRAFADVVSIEDTGIEIPKIRGGSPTIVKCEFEVEGDLFVEKIIKRMQNMPPDPREDNMLVATNDGRKAALDMRLIDSSLKDSPVNKVNACAEKIVKDYNDSTSIKGTQLVFCDLSVPSKSKARLRKEYQKEIEAAMKEDREPKVSEDDLFALEADFSVYDSLKDKLIGYGIPENEIAFIHDHSTDAKRPKLFKNVRDGNVRVLIGSTSKMGEGTNVQDRIVSIHHLDVPWRPSDIEQRDGRGLRHGNMNDEVNIYRYITEGSFDTYSWQLIEYKANTIHTFNTGKAGDSIDDIGTAALTAAEAKAAATGNPLIQELHSLKTETRRLKVKEADLRSMKVVQRQKKIKMAKEIERAGQRIDQIEEDKKKLSANPNNTVTIKGKKFDIGDKTENKEDQKKISSIEKETWQEIESAFQSVDAKPHRTEHAYKQIEIDYRGYPTIIREYISDPKKEKAPNRYEVSIGFHTSQPYVVYNSALNYLRRVGKMKEDNVKNGIKYNEQRIKDAEAAIQSADELLGQEFDEAKKLQQNIDRISEIQAELSKKEEPEKQEILDDGYKIEKFSTSSDRAAPGEKVTEEMILKAFKGQQAGKSYDGSIWVRVKNGLGIKIHLVEKLSDKDYKIAISTGQMTEDGTIYGKYEDGSITISSKYADMLAFGHEVVHFLETSGILTNAELKTIDMKIASLEKQGKLDFVLRKNQQENRANFLSQAISDRKAYRRTAIGRILQKIGDFFDALLNISKVSIRKLAKEIETGKIYSREPGKPRPVDGPLYSVDPYRHLPDEPRRRILSGKGVSPLTVIDKSKSFLKTFIEQTKHFPGLTRISDTKEMAVLKEKLRQFQEIPARSQDEALRIMRDTVGGLSKTEYDAFTLRVILGDEVRSIKDGLRTDDNLPFGFQSTAEVIDSYNKIDSDIEKNMPKVREALIKRDSVHKSVARGLVNYGILKKEVLASGDYFHHQILQYWNIKEARVKGIGTSSKDVRTHWRPWMASRKGSPLDYNTEYFEAEIVSFAQQLAQLETARAIESIKRTSDITPELKAAAKRTNNRLMMEILDDQGLLERDAFGIPEDPLKPFNTKIAIGIGNLVHMAGKGRLEYDSEFQDVINNMIAVYQASKKGGLPAELNYPKFFHFLSHTIEADNNGSGWAAMIFKAIQERNKFVKDVVGDRYVKYDDLVPDGYVKWRPDKKNKFFYTNSITDQVLEQLATGEKKITEIEVRKVLAKGQDVYWVIPEGLAETMDNFRPGVNRDLLSQSSKTLMGLWKQYILINPLSVLRYNANNFSGDLDAVLAYRPSIASPKAMLRAASDIMAWMKNKGSIPQDVIDARDKGVLNSGWSIQEVEDTLKVLSAERLVNEVLLEKKAGPVQKYFAKARSLTTFRENILRLSSYRWFKQHLEAGDKVYGASKVDEINALVEKGMLEDAAAKMARELLGDYGAISRHGEFIRAHMLPFYSWLEINAPRYVYLLRNSKHEGGKATGSKTRIAGVVAKRAGIFALKASMLMAAISLYNGLIWPDEEEELGESGRRQMHIILGRRSDGSIITIRFQGALSDALSFFGAEDLPFDLKDIAEGKSTIQEKLLEAPKAFSNRIIQGTRPDVKTAFETITGKALYPDVFTPRPIRDKVEHVLRTFKLDMPYKWGTGRGHRGDSLVGKIANDLASVAIYTTEPGMQAYYDTRRMVFDWQEKNGIEKSYGTPTKRGNALYYYKEALRYGDIVAAKRFIKRYVGLGGTIQGLKQSIKMTHPLAGIPMRQRNYFVRNLTKQQQRSVRKGISWYNMVYKQKKWRKTQ